MADTKLSDLATASTAGYSDLLYLVQGGVSKRIAVNVFVTSLATLVNSSYATMAYVTATLVNYTTNANLTSTLSLYATDIELAAAITTSNAALTATLLSYTTNANLTSTLASYTTNANLTSTLASYTTNVNLTSTLASYTTNANLTSTLASYTTNANLTSTLLSYTTNANLTSTLASYTTNANLTSTLAAFTVSKLQYSSLTVQLDSSGSVTFPGNGQIRNGYPGLTGSSGDGSNWFVTPPSQPGGVASADGEQYIQINNNLDIEIGTNYTSSSGNSWSFRQDGTTTLPVPAYVPTTITSTGTTGQVTWDSGYIYVCIASNTWRRAALTTW